MKPLLPTMKERKRYIVYELISDRPVRNGQQSVVDHLNRTLGLFDSAKAGIIPVKYEHQRQIGILRVAHTAVDKVCAALMLLDTIDGTPIIPRTRGVSGILKKTARFM